LKDAARLLIYFAATLLFGALMAPVLFWTAQRLGVLTQFDFESFFHRALLLGALIFFWPLFRSLGIKGWRDLGLQKNPHRIRDVVIGFFAAAVPLLCFGALIIALKIYQLRETISIAAVAGRSVSALIVPLIEEPLFRGLILGVLLRASPRYVAVFFTSAVFSILHFLKAPEKTAAVVHWNSGFISIANSFNQFTQALLLAAGFTTLFLLAWILADARLRTRSLWLPIGLHAGWIFSSALFNKIAHREMEALPWLGKSLLIGLAPLAVALITWTLVRLWLRNENRPA